MKSTPILLGLLVLSGLGAIAAGTSSTASAPVRVSLVRPITIRKAQDLWFGCLLVDAGSGQLQIVQTAADGGGTRKPDPAGVTQLLQNAEPWHNAMFEVGGQSEAAFSVAMPGHPIVIHGPAQETMLVRLNYYCSGTMIDPQGTAIWVGGRLDIPENPRPGHYSGDFEVTVAYQ